MWSSGPPPVSPRREAYPVWVYLALEGESALLWKQPPRLAGPEPPSATRYIQYKILHAHDCNIETVEREAVEELTHHQNRSRGPRRDLHRVSWADVIYTSYTPFATTGVISRAGTSS